MWWSGKTSQMSLWLSSDNQSKKDWVLAKIWFYCIKHTLTLLSHGLKKHFIERVEKFYLFILSHAFQSSCKDYVVYGASLII